MTATERDRQTLRTQAAALMAQHITLTEWEDRLHDRAAALSQEEQEISARLEQRRQQVESWQEQVHKAREQLRDERADLTRLRQAQAEEKEQLEALRRQRHEQEAELERRRIALERQEAELPVALRTFDEQRQQQQADLNRQRQRQEQAQKNLLAAQERLQAQRQQVQDGAAQLTAHLSELRVLHQRAAAEQHQYDQRVEDLKLEARGLENRIINTRKLLFAGDATPPPVLSPDPAVALTPVSLPAELNTLMAERDAACTLRQKELATQSQELADQRQVLVELRERLVQAGRVVQSQQLATLEQLERIGTELQAREQVLEERTNEAEEASELARRERQALRQRRLELERATAEQQRRQIDWTAEREHTAAALAHAEQRCARRETALQELFHRLRERRHAELQRQREGLAQLEVERARYAEQADDWTRRVLAIRVAQQALTEQALALAQARQEFLEQTDRPDAADCRLERLRRIGDRRVQQAQRALDKKHAAIAAERARVQQDQQLLLDQATHLAVQERALAQRIDEFESQRKTAVEVEDKLTTVGAAWEIRRRQYEMQIDELRALIARLAQGDNTVQLWAA